MESLAGIASTPYTLMAGLGANGTAGIKSTQGPTTQWPQILGGEGGPVVIDPANAGNWYANNDAGVSIHLCAQAGACTAAEFGSQAVVTNSDTGNDGLTMTTPAPFLVDPVDSSQLLIATCRLWRGPANGQGWTSSNAITPILGGGPDCGSSPQIRSIAATAIHGGGEIVYVGLYGTLNGGGNMGGHVLAAGMSSTGTWSGWTDLTLDPVTNDTVGFNAYNLDVAGLTIDPHDATGQTIYATIAGIPDRSLNIRTAYRSTDGGTHWTPIMGNLIYSPANALLVDPVDANTVYIATDAGVFATQQVSACGSSGVSCWAAYGNGLPEAPVTSLAATQPTGTPNVLIAGTYGRGIWQIPLLTAGRQMTTAGVSPTSLSFGSQPESTTSAAETVTLSNTGGIALTPTSIEMEGDFAETDNCAGDVINTGQGCEIQVTFSPTALGARSGQLTIQGNIAGGNIVIGLSGTGSPPPAVTLSPASVNFASQETGTTSAALQITAANSGGVAAGISSVTVTGPFVLASNACGSSLAAGSDCQLTVEFSPASNGPASGKLTMVDDAGTQAVALSGTGTAPPTDTLAPGSLTFAATVIGVSSSSQSVTLTNSGGNPLTSISISAGGPFQQSNNCTTQLSGPASCTINVVFIPTATGIQSGSLTVADLLRTQTVALQGTGVNPPAFLVTPPSLTFSGGQTGVAGAPQTLTVTNSGGAAMANIGFQIAGSAAASFNAGSTTCGAALNAGADCTLQVTYTPPASGAVSANLIVSTSTRGPDNSAITATVPLNGGGAGAGGIQAQPAQVGFPVTGVGHASSPVSVSLTNLNSAAAFGSLSISASSPFQIAGNNCGGSLAAGATCTVNVAFAPSIAGSQAGALTIASSALSTPLSVPLSGIGFDFSPSITGSASQTVSSGETATYALTLAPSAGASASFTFQCQSLPQYASCSFNPATLAVAANATGTETIQIATGQSASATARLPRSAGTAPVWLACGALLLWPLARRRRRKWILLLLLAVIAATSGMGCSGAGGGSGGTVRETSGDTPAGTYTVPVVISDNGVQHTVTLTLVVD